MREDWAHYHDNITTFDKWVAGMLNELEESGEADNTIVFYYSDHGAGMARGKRWLYDTGMHVPLIIRFGKNVKHLQPGETGTATDRLVSFVDFAPTLLDMVGLDAPDAMQGVSARGVLEGQTPDDWQQSIYYRYWMDAERTHHTTSHYGVRTRTHKLVYFYADPLDAAGAGDVNVGVDPYWELFDLTRDPDELKNIYGQPGTEQITQELKDELHERFGDQPVEEVD